MLNQALAWASEQFDAFVAQHVGCCCSSELRGQCPTAGETDPSKFTDLVVAADWDTAENPPGFMGSFFDPAAQTHQLGPGEVLPPFGLRDTSRPRCSPREPTQESEVADVEAVQLRVAMKRFVQEMVSGRELKVLVECDRTEACRLTLTPSLTHIQLHISGAVHEIPIKSIRDICAGKLQAPRSVPVELDDRCATVVLRNSECVSFRFDDVSQRSEFTKCLKVLALAVSQ